MGGGGGGKIFRLFEKAYFRNGSYLSADLVKFICREIEIGV